MTFVGECSVSTQSQPAFLVSSDYGALDKINSPISQDQPFLNLCIESWILTISENCPRIFLPCIRGRYLASPNNNPPITSARNSPRGITQIAVDSIRRNCNEGLSGCNAGNVPAICSVNSQLAVSGNVLHTVCCLSVRLNHDPISKQNTQAHGQSAPPGLHHTPSITASNHRLLFNASVDCISFPDCIFPQKYCTLFLRTHLIRTLSL